MEVPIQVKEKVEEFLYQPIILILIIIIVYAIYIGH